MYDKIRYENIKFVSLEIRTISSRLRTDRYTTTPPTWILLLN